MKRIKVVVPIPMDEAGVAARAGQLPAEFFRAGFQPESVAGLTNADGGATLFNNTDFQRLRDGKFQEAGVYMSGSNVLV